MTRLRGFLLCAVTLASPGLLATASCGEKEEAAPPAEAGDEYVILPKRDAGGTASDAAVDIPFVKPPPPTIPGCVGTALPLEVAGERAYVSIRIGANDAGDAEAGAPGVSGNFVVDFGTTGSTIDYGAFSADAGPVPASYAGDGGLGADHTFQGFDFFGDWGFVTLRRSDYSTIASLTRQAGILGTDFLALHPYTLDYTRGQIWRSDPKTFCTDPQLLGAGFSPLPSEGFYTTDLSKLRPLSDVLNSPDGGTAGFTVPNVPTVPITVAGVSALAQLDTGYDDRLIRHSINVNQALFTLLSQKGPEKLVRDELADVYLTTCIPGFSEKVLAYRLADGQEVDFIASGGSVARREPAVAIFVKEQTAETEKCGGIGTWTVPAAQVGSSFFVDAQAMVFDPASSRVWVPKN